MARAMPTVTLDTPLVGCDYRNSEDEENMVDFVV